MKKFTLIELFVIISTIGILMAVLMPALSQSRSKARQAVCLVQQKQLNVSFNIYIAENNGYGPGGPIRWTDSLGITENKNSAGGNRDLECPEGTPLNGIQFWGTNISMNNRITNNYAGGPSFYILRASPSETVATMDSYQIYKGAFSNWMTPEQLTNGPLEENIARHNSKANLIYLDNSGKAKPSKFLQTKNNYYDTFWDVEL